MDKLARQNFELTQVLLRVSDKHQLLCEIRNSLAAIRRNSNELLYLLRKTQERDVREKYAALAVWGMKIKNFTTLGSNLASVKDLKRIQSLHSLCCGFVGDKTSTTRWLSGRVQV